MAMANVFFVDKDFKSKINNVYSALLNALKIRYPKVGIAFASRVT